MKKIGLFLTAALFCIGTMTMMQSCSKPCKDDPCGANGACVEDGKDYTCTCETGYEGELCDTEERAKFLSTYELTDGCDANKYNSTISTSTTDVTKVLISNMANVFIASTIADISGTNITIAEQVPDNDDWKVEGTGSINGSVITMSYTVTEPDNTTHTCATTWTQQ